MAIIQEAKVNSTKSTNIFTPHPRSYIYLKILKAQVSYFRRLTINKTNRKSFAINVISHSLNNTNFAEIKVKTELHEYIGHEQIITFSYLGQELLGKFASSIDVEIDKEMTLFIDLNNISIFDKDTKQRI